MFRDASLGWTGGVVYDFQANVHAGVFGSSPSMGQMRGQIGYTFRGHNQFGLFATYDTGTTTSQIGSLSVQFRAISQINAFWMHTFKNQGWMTLWAGTPYRKGLMFPSGRAGTFIVGAGFKAPLTGCLSVEGHAVYMGAHGDADYPGSHNYASNVSVGLSYAFGSKQIGARPYMSLGNNSNFLVDTNMNY